MFLSHEGDWARVERIISIVSFKIVAVRKYVVGQHAGFFLQQDLILQNNVIVSDPVILQSNFIKHFLPSLKILVHVLKVLDGIRIPKRHPKGTPLFLLLLRLSIKLQPSVL